MADDKKRILLVGAAGAIGRRLVPMLVGAGHKVWGTTRSADKAKAIEALGARAIVADVFDAPSLERAAIAIDAEIVINQLTDLPARLDSANMQAAMAANALVREIGTRNLAAAAIAAGAHRLISQSICWLYAPGPQPHSEADRLDLAAEGARGISVKGVVALEHATLHSPPLHGMVLRYGQLYGPGTWNDKPTGNAPLHVDAAAHAALLAIDRGVAGHYNIAEDTGYVAIDKARAELGFDPGFRLDGP